jgi:hypothetical protein
MPGVYLSEIERMNLRLKLGRERAAHEKEAEIERDAKIIGRQADKRAEKEREKRRRKVGVAVEQIEYDAKNAKNVGAQPITSGRSLNGRSLKKIAKKKQARLEAATVAAARAKAKEEAEEENGSDAEGRSDKESDNDDDDEGKAYSSNDDYDDEELKNAFIEARAIEFHEESLEMRKRLKKLGIAADLRNVCYLCGGRDVNRPRNLVMKGFKGGGGRDQWYEVGEHHFCYPCANNATAMNEYAKTLAQVNGLKGKVGVKGKSEVKEQTVLGKEKKSSLSLSLSL